VSGAWQVGKRCQSGRNHSAPVFLLLERADLLVCSYNLAFPADFRFNSSTNPNAHSPYSGICEA
jgi:hypothetical protein